MSVFAQENFTDNSGIIKLYNHETDDEDIKAMTDILHHVGTDPEERKELDNEMEAQRTYKEWFGEKDKIIAEKDAALVAEKAKADAALAAKDAALAEKDAALAAEKAKADAALARIAALEATVQQTKNNN
jgi:hypothetical protein